MDLEKQIEQGLDNELVKEFLSFLESTPWETLPLITDFRILGMIGQLSEDRREQLGLLSDVDDLAYTFIPDFREYKTADEQQEFQKIYDGVAQSTLGLMERYQEDLPGFHQSVAEIYDGASVPEIEPSGRSK